RVYTDRNCNLCHLLNGTGVSLATDLKGIGSRRDSGWLNEFLENHQEPAPQSTTPKLILSDTESRALARYLETLK
ncbi:MAG: c-type cytochrome, partial [Acidobacteriota bacterium]